MSLQVQTNPPDDPVKSVGDLIVQTEQRILISIQISLVRIVNSISSVTPKAFWEAQGPNGGAILAEFGYWIEVLQLKNSSLITPQLASAAANLTVGTDGTVSVVA